MFSSISRIISIVYVVMLGITCNKFEDDHEQICFKPHIDYVIYFIDPIKQTIKIDSVTFLNGSKRQIKWDFGDGSSSILDKPIHPYKPKSTSESYKLSLLATNACGESIWYKTITIGPCLAVPKFESVVAKDKVTFHNITKIGDLKILRYKWDFGDGQIDLTESPLHTYSKPGKYMVRFTITTDCGENTTQEEITIECFKEVTCNNCLKIVENGWNIRSFSLTSVTGGITVEWNFGDGSVPVKSLSHTYIYQSEGRYTVIATITNECMSQSFKDTVNILKPKQDYEPFNLPNLSGSNNFHQIVYFNGNAYILNSVGYFYSFDLSTNNLEPLQSSEFIIDEYNKLKRDAVNHAIWNVGSKGARKFEDKIWKAVGGVGIGVNTRINDIDCDFNGHYFAIGTGKSIVYNTVSKNYFIITSPDRYLTIFNPVDGERKGPVINQLDNFSFGLVVNQLTGDIYFINSSGIVITNSMGAFKQFLSKTNVTLLTSSPKKILPDLKNNIWALMHNGSLIRINLSTLIGTIVWPSSINDFDVFNNVNDDPDLLIAGNGILKHLIKN